MWGLWNWQELSPFSASSLPVTAVETMSTIAALLEFFRRMLPYNFRGGNCPFFSLLSQKEEEFAPLDANHFSWRVNHIFKLKSSHKSCFPLWKRLKTLICTDAPQIKSERYTFVCNDIWSSSVSGMCRLSILFSILLSMFFNSLIISLLNCSASSA